jgi:hypothetical protein
LSSWWKTVLSWLDLSRLQPTTLPALSPVISRLPAWLHSRIATAAWWIVGTSTQTPVCSE